MTVCVHGLVAGCLLWLPTLAVHAPADSLRFTIDAPASARVGEPVPITLRLTNPSGRPIDAYFLGRTIAFDIVVTLDDGTVVWRRLAGAAVPSILQVRTLAPGEVLEWKDRWQPQRAGRYRVQGMLPSDAPEPRRTAQIEVVIT